MLRSKTSEVMLVPRISGFIQDFFLLLWETTARKACGSHFCRNHTAMEGHKLTEVDQNKIAFWGGRGMGAISVWNPASTSLHLLASVLPGKICVCVKQFVYSLQFGGAYQWLGTCIHNSTSHSLHQLRNVSNSRMLFQLNHLLHTWHWAAPLCSLTGLLLSNCWMQINWQCMQFCWRVEANVNAVILTNSPWKVPPPPPTNGRFFMSVFCFFPPQRMECKPWLPTLLWMRCLEELLWAQSNVLTVLA
jgi:hypothetical protein